MVIKPLLKKRGYHNLVQSVGNSKEKEYQDSVSKLDAKLD